MELTQAQIKQFQQLYKEHFSIELSEDEAVEKGSLLLLMMKRVYKPLPKQKYEYGNENEPAGSKAI